MSGRPAAILLFGASATGKTSVGKALSQALPRAALVEVDVLRYLVGGGLVAWSGGASPLDAPDEYARQCALGYRNAVSLCRNFLAAGIHCVVEGLGEACRPGSGFAEENLPGAPVHSAVLLCEQARWEERLRARSWSPEHLRGARAEFDWHRDHAELFDVAVDTSERGAAESAAALLGALDLGG